MEWYLKVLGQYADFTGRARRKEYWMFTLISLIISVVLAILDSVLNFDSNAGAFNFGLLGGLYSLAVLLPTWAVGVLRLHDIGRSGWWMLLGFIPVIGWIVLIVFFATHGQPRPKPYGPTRRPFRVKLPSPPNNDTCPVHPLPAHRQSDTVTS